jgi:predicted phosphoribosyltransferase
VNATTYFSDRYDAGRRLGAVLRPYADDRPLIVVGLPPGGVPVAARVAETLVAPLAIWRGAANCDGECLPLVVGETVILVDDGAMTGRSMRTAILALRKLGPRAIIAALPAASRDVAHSLRSVADDCVCVVEPDPFHGVEGCYDDFADVSDAETRGLLADAARRWGRGAPTRMVAL